MKKVCCWKDYDKKSMTGSKSLSNLNTKICSILCCKSKSFLERNVKKYVESNITDLQSYIISKNLLTRINEQKRRKKE